MRTKQLSAQGRTRGPTKKAIGLLVGLAALASAISVGTPPAQATVKIATAKRKAVAPNFAVKFTDDVQSVTAGDTATYRFDVTQTSTFKGTVIFDLPNLTDQFTGRIFPEAGDSVRLELTVPPLATTNSGVFILRGRSGLLVQRAVFRLNVTARPIPTTTTIAAPTPTVVIAPKFTVTSDVAGRTSLPGELQQYPLTVSRTDGYTGPIDFRVDGLPTGATANFAPNPTSGSTVFYVTPTDATKSGTYPMSIVASAGSTVRVTSVLLVVRRNGAFTLGVAPLSVSTPRGNDAVAGLNVLQRGTAIPPDVTFTAAGLPAGATAVFEPNPSNGLGTVRIRTTPATRLGTYNVTIRGASGVFSSSISLRVTVLDGNTTPGFGLSATPVTQQISAGTATNINVAITPTGKFAAPITLRVNGLPPLASFAVVSQTPTSAVIRINTAATTPTGTSALKIIGESGSLSATVETSLVVT